jgi:hypothetical protein
MDALFILTVYFIGVIAILFFGCIALVNNYSAGECNFVRLLVAAAFWPIFIIIWFSIRGSQESYRMIKEALKK